MHIRLAPGHMRGHSFFPANAPARYRAHFPSAHRSATAPREREQRTGRALTLTGERLVAAVSGAVLLVLSVWLVVAAVAAPPAALSAPVSVPWRSAASGGLLPYAHPQAVAAPPLLPGLTYLGPDLPYRQW